MTKYWPHIKLKVGYCVSFDGMVAPIIERESDDEFVVGRPAGFETWHIDKFAQLANEANEVTIREINL